MDPELWKRVDALLDRALAQPPEVREQFVVENSKDDAELRAEVLSLLKAQDQAAGFMERSAMRVAAENLANDSNLTTSFSLTGKQLANYKIEKLLGAGGMGEVYLAHESKLNRKVALKILPWHFVADSERAARFQREARALSALNHPYLVTIYEVGEVNGLHFIAMEFVEGQTLASLREKLTFREVLPIVAQVAEALAAAHHAGIVHRDIKPENITVRHDGYAKVLDFGLVKLNEVAAAVEDDANTKHGVAMGTLAYMSPEQAAGEPVDQRTDIWSLGVVLYELVTRKKPFRGESRQATINAILSHDPQSVTKLDASLPSELDQVLKKALEKDRELRYQTASDFRADILRLLKMIDSAATVSNAPAITGSIRIPVRRAWLRPLIGLFALILIAVPVIWYFTRSNAGPDWSRASHVQLTTQAGTEFFPTISPDGEDFVFAAYQNGSFDLYRQRVGGKNVQPLTPNTPSDEFEAAWSPDGKHIAFYSNREPAGVYVMEPTGENVRPVIGACHHPFWSPDSKEIVCSTAGRATPSTRTSTPSSLWIADVATGAKRLLCEHDAMNPSWSPNGQRIAFWFRPPNVGRSDIATIAKSGGEIEVITRDAATNWNPVWSPDGKFLYFASDRSGNMSFWRVRIDEETGRTLGEPEAVSPPSNYSRHLNFSSNGKRLIYVQTDRESNIEAIKFDPKLERTVGEPFAITKGDREITRPELSSDGTQFVMRVPRRMQDDILIVQRDGTNWRDITNDRFFDRYPRWSPDGKKIAFTSDRSGRYEIWVIDADGTNLRQVTFNNSGDTSFPLWSPDGTRLLFHHQKGNVILDLTKDWGSQTLEHLPPTDRPFVAWDWSLDGKKLIGTFPGEKTAYYSFETRQYEMVSDLGGYPMWLPDSTRYLSMSAEKAYLGNVSTKRVKELFSLKDEEFRGIAISRDSQLIYFSAYSTESDVWMMELP